MVVLAATNIDLNRIYASFDNGLSFSYYSDGLGVNAITELFTATDSFLIAGMDYNGVWRRLRPGLEGEASQEQEVPREFRLEQNYPNPFNPATKITYSIPEAGYVSIKIYDMLGHEVAALIDEIKQPGKYSIVWDASGFAGGIYFYKLASEQFTSTKKMVLIK
jgi:Secretion system C-terminal sorting domain